MHGAEVYVDASAAMLDLPLTAQQRPGVVRYLELAAAMADLVMAFPLAVDDDSGSVFVPVAPSEPGDG